MSNMIIDESVFETVRKLRENKKRPTRLGELPLFSGLVVCADCGSKLYYHRGKNRTRDEEHYCCSKYRQRTAAALETELSEQEKQSVNVDRFMKMVRKHVGMKELAPELLHEMIEKIVIHAPDKSSGKRKQQVDIHYSFGIGIIDLDSEAATAQTGKKAHEKTA